MVRSPRGCLTQQIGADPMFKGPGVPLPGPWGHPSPNLLFRPAPDKRFFGVGAGDSTPCRCCWRGSMSSRDGPGCWRAVGGGQRAEEAPPTPLRRDPQLLLWARNSGPMCPVPLLLFVPEMPLGGDSCWSHKSHWTCRAGMSNSRDGPAVSLPRSLASGSPRF